jgi:hypothetical protein
MIAKRLLYKVIILSFILTQSGIFLHRKTAIFTETQHSMSCIFLYRKTAPYTAGFPCTGKKTTSRYAPTWMKIEKMARTLKRLGEKLKEK